MRKKHKKRGFYKRQISVVKPEPPLITSIKESQVWGRILDAIADEEVRQLALTEYAKIGEIRTQECIQRDE